MKTAQSINATPKDNETVELIKSFLAAWGTFDSKAVIALFADDARFVGSVGPEPGRTYIGKAAIAAAVQTMLTAAAGTVMRVREIIPFEDGAVATWSVHPNADAPLTALGIDIFRIRNGKILLKDAYRKLT